MLVDEARVLIKYKPDTEITIVETVDPDTEKVVWTMKVHVGTSMRYITDPLTQAHVIYQTLYDAVTICRDTIGHRHPILHLLMPR